MSEAEKRIKLLEEKLADMEQRVIPHVCHTCGWFTFSKGGDAPRNRYCQYPGEIKLENGRCVFWKAGEDLWRRHPRNITV